MGTRNLTLVIDRRGDLKVAQYGQWDGYPEGQGVNVLTFAKDKEKMDKLEKVLEKVKFFDDCHDIDEYLKGYDARCPEYSNEPDNRTDEDKYWFKNLITRDLCSNILDSLITLDTTKLPKEHNGIIYLKNSEDFGKEEGFFGCEWAYCINFKENLLQCYTDLNDFLTEYDLNCLPTNEEFCKELNKLAGFGEDDEE